MESTKILLIIFTIIKVIVVFYLTGLLYSKWRKQSKRYLSDFPCLMSELFALYGITKIFDIFLYVFGNTSQIIMNNDTNSAIMVILGRLRIFLGTLAMVPLLLLMLEIWIPEKRKLSLGLGIGWVLLGITGTIISQTYVHLLIFLGIIVSGPILFAIISFIIIHHTRKLPQLNCRLLALGWSIFLILQTIRPIWKNMGLSGTWGLTWIGELIDIFALIIIGIGFLTHASYGKRKKQFYMKTSLFEEAELN
ncbi:MAG: hypothetical protein ACTSVU_09850 [Promethearchaeota archaeon]